MNLKESCKKGEGVLTARIKELSFLQLTLFEKNYRRSSLILSELYVFPVWKMAKTVLRKKRYQNSNWPYEKFGIDILLHKNESPSIE